MQIEFQNKLNIYLVLMVHEVYQVSHYLLYQRSQEYQCSSLVYFLPSQQELHLHYLEVAQILPD